MDRSFEEVCPFVTGNKLINSDYILQGKFFQDHKFAFTFLPDREKFVLEQRCGMVTGNVVALVEIGKTLGLSGERIRQIENNAFRILRRSEVVELLKNYTDETFDKSLYMQFAPILSRAIQKEILDNMDNDLLEFIKNLSIYNLKLGTKTERGILNRLERGGISTCGQLIQYMERYPDFTRFGFSKVLTSNIVNAIYNLIKGGYEQVEEENLRDVREKTNHESYKTLDSLIKRGCLDSAKDIYIEDLDLSARTFNCLKRVKAPRVQTVGDVIRYYELFGQFSKTIKNLGVGSEKELLKVLVDLGTQVDSAVGVSYGA